MFKLQVILMHINIEASQPRKYSDPIASDNMMGGGRSHHVLAVPPVCGCCPA